jgi:hypothetical protein
MSDNDLVRLAGWLREPWYRTPTRAECNGWADRIEQLQAQLAAEQKGCEQAMQDAADWRDDNVRLTAVLAAADEDAEALAARITARCDSLADKVALAAHRARLTQTGDGT